MGIFQQLRSLKNIARISSKIAFFILGCGKLLSQFILNLTKTTIKSFSLFIFGLWLKSKKVLKKISTFLNKKLTIFHLLSQRQILVMVAFLILLTVFIEAKIATSEQIIYLKSKFEEIQANNEPEILVQINEIEKPKADFKIALNEGFLIKEEPNFILNKNIDSSNQNQEKKEKPSLQTYTVKSGDTLIAIAKKFGLNLETILWENKLTARSIIRPGQELKILPVDGLTHKVKKGENLTQIASIYKASLKDIIEYNQIEDPSQIQIGQILIIPNGKIPPLPSKPTRRIVVERSNNQENVRLEDYGIPAINIGGVEVIRNYKINWPKGKNCRRFVPGQCTYWVASKRCIPWSGHAKDWIRNARAKGYQIGSEPKIGAIVALKENGWFARRYGHVAYVEDVENNTITISEMNYRGPWVVTMRKLNKNDPRIIGYIY